MIYHIINSEEWEKVRASGVYRPESLAAEGFIHFSTLAQSFTVANRFYTGQKKLILLEVDCRLLPAEIVYEDLYNHGDKFPHLYAELNPEAVVAVHALITNENGSISLPPALQEKGASNDGN